MWLNEIKDIPYTDIVNTTIQFMAISDRFHRMPYAYCCKVEELVNDWWGDCDFVPENDAILLSVTLYINGKAHPIERIGLSDRATFEVLMDVLTLAIRK
jgi:hypothetical protein